MARCQKFKFRDRIAAELAAARNRNVDTTKRQDQRAYRCNMCRSWHLTSQPRKKPDGETVPVLPSKCPPHIWTPLYDKDRNIIGRVCTKCGLQQGG